MVNYQISQQFPYHDPPIIVIVLLSSSEMLICFDVSDKIEKTVRKLIPKKCLNMHIMIAQIIYV